MSLLPEIRRKAIHLSFILVPLIYLYDVLPKRFIVRGLLAAVLVSLVFELARMHDARVRLLLSRFFRDLVRRHESKQLLGSTYLLIAAVLTIELFSKEIAVAVAGRAGPRRHRGRARGQDDRPRAHLRQDARGERRLLRGVVPVRLGRGRPAGLAGRLRGAHGDAVRAPAGAARRQLPHSAVGRLRHEAAGRLKPCASPPSTSAPTRSTSSSPRRRRTAAFDVLDREREVVQVGRGSFADGRLRADAIARTARVARALRRAGAAAMGAERIVCTATAAVREARNGGDFVRAARAGVGHHAARHPRARGGPAHLARRAQRAAAAASEPVAHARHRRRQRCSWCVCTREQLLARRLACRSARCA